MYGDFHAKNTVFTPYIPINVWFWPTLSMCGRRSCCWLCCCTWATRTLHTLPLAVGCATHGPIAPYTPYFLLLAVLHMGHSYPTHLTSCCWLCCTLPLVAGCAAAHGPLVPYTPYLLLDHLYLTPAVGYAAHGPLAPYTPCLPHTTLCMCVCLSLNALIVPV